MNHTTLLQHLPDLQLSRLTDVTEAGLWITSLPWPRAAQMDLSLAGAATFDQPLGQWPGEAAGTPRRQLLVADGNNSAPETLSVTSGAGPVPTASMTAEAELFARSPHKEYVWERHLLRLRWGNQTVGLAMGLKTGDEIHWWEACRLVTKEQTAQCLVVEMGGAIPLREMSFEEFQSPGYSNPYLHKHNWLNGHITARLHANGVCEIFAHHVNSKFFDDGADLQDAVPVIGFATDAGVEEITSLCGEWDGTRDELSLGSVRFCLDEVSRLATPKHPGSVTTDGRFTVLQPYQGMELFGGLCPIELTGDPYVFRAEDQVIPRGMARTLRFSLSLSDRSPRIARYLAPAWWYGACEELVPAPLLPVSDELDGAADEAARWVTQSIERGGFEDGSIPRGTSRRISPDSSRFEPGWEGEIPYALLLHAWRSGDADEYFSALRSAYYITDVCVDHATNMMRMHGFPPPAISIPMNRAQGSIGAYLETGDSYLLDTAQALTIEAFFTHKNSWPRLAVGRDACFIRSAVLLYRYFATDYFLQIAREGIQAVIESQRENGSFGDQGGGAGIHQWGGYISKPWMGLLATNGVLDFLELSPDEPAMLQCIRKFADWLMAERLDHDGVKTWSYQHDFDGGRTHFQPSNGQHQVLPGPGAWHQEGLGRLLTYCSLRFKQPEYYAAWAESHASVRPCNGDHGAAATLQFIPWVQSQLRQATLAEDGGVRRNPPLNGHAPAAAKVLTPAGEVLL